MNTCDTCKHWQPTGKAENALHQIGNCKHPKVAAHAAHSEPDGASDGEDFAGIFTGPKFGCVHHEEDYRFEDRD